MIIWLLLGLVSLLWIIIEHIGTGQGLQPINAADLPVIIFVICMGPISLLYMIADFLRQRGII